MGGTLAHDVIGVSRQTDVAVNYSYHIKMKKGQLALGLKGMVSFYSANLTALKIWDQNDQVFMSDIQNKWIPNFGAGAYYYTDRFYAGISVPHLLNYNKPSTFLSAQISRVPHYERHYFAAAGYVFNLQDKVYLKPSTLIKYVPNAPVEADLNMNVFFMRIFR
ncbi:MAG: type IX secretion system membrane protein PorP/SprF [Taibaiella sp.]|nr:type IX secretion system membrane protein PorP/SprF [Taibaiella sp.]